MSWTERPDKEACCGEEPGAVRCEERVVKYLHSANLHPDTLAFTRRDLQADRIAEPSNDCGDSHGCSVDRVGDASDAELLEKSEAYARAKEGRAPCGGLVATVGALRRIPHQSAPEGAVRVYDDPRADNDAHAVMRVSRRLSRPEFNEVRRRIIQCFGYRVA